MRGIIQTRKIRCAYGVSFRKRWTPDLELHGEDFKEEHKQVIAYGHWAVTNRNIERGIRYSMPGCNNCMQQYVRKARNIILRLRSYSNQKSGRRVYREDRDPSPSSAQLASSTV
jgi:aconitase B